jgi:hypothetical protein
MFGDNRQLIDEAGSYRVVLPVTIPVPVFVFGKASPTTGRVID